MNFIEHIFLFFKKLFYKDTPVKFLEAPKKNIEENKRNNFINSLKIKQSVRKKQRIETLTCVGDGLGIQNKIEY